jgi:hypothetical protein
MWCDGGYRDGVLGVHTYRRMHAPEEGAAALEEEKAVSSLSRWCGVSYCPRPRVVDPTKASSCVCVVEWLSG